MRYAVLVTGPAGAGKSTFSASFLTHLSTSKRTGHLVNLDPAASTAGFEYVPVIDIKDLAASRTSRASSDTGRMVGLFIALSEYLLQNMDWLEEELGSFENDYLVIDCPGQIELYTHHSFLPTLVRNLNRLGIRTCAVYLIESQFMEDKYKFFSGVLSAMSAMVNLEIPWINVMSKMDLVTSNKDDPVEVSRGTVFVGKEISLGIWTPTQCFWRQRGARRAPRTRDSMPLTGL